MNRFIRSSIIVLFALFMLLNFSFAEEQVPVPYDHLTDSTLQDSIEQQNLEDIQLQQQIVSLVNEVVVLRNTVQSQSEEISKIKQEIELLKSELPSKERPSSPTLNYLIIILSIAAVSVIIIYFIMIKDREKKLGKLIRQDEQRANQLKKYVSYHLSRGHHPMHLKNFLLKQGYRTEEVEKAFSK